MANWRKHLAEMVADTDPRSYTYDEAAGVLRNLGFSCATGKGSHRKFRREIEEPGDPPKKRGVIIGLVDAGKGTLKPAYIREMVRTLRENDLLPREYREDEPS